MPYVGRELTRGSYLKLDTIADQFNGSKTTFDLQSGGSAFYPGSSTSILVSIGGTVQEPVTQYGVDRSQIVFTTPPSNGQSFFAVALGVALGTGVPSKNSVGGAELSKPFNYEDGLLYLDSANDRVGIHTTSPSHPFHVVGDMVVDGNIRGNIHNTTGIATFRNIRVDGDLIVDGDTTTLNTTLREVEVLHVDANTTAAAGIITQRGVGDVLQLWDGSTNKQHFVVADNGKVGIGSTAVPTADLEIHGGVENPSLALKRNTGGGDVASIAWHAENASPTKVAQINYRGSVPSPGMQFYTNGGTSAEQRMVIDLEGKVGIGTRIPQKFLELRTTNPTINVKATGGNDASIELVETTNPNFGAAGAAGFRIRYDGGDNRLYITSGEETNVYNRVSIERDTGNFGIGVDDPTAKLQVNGTQNGLQARFGGTGTGLGVSCFQKTNNNAGVIFHAQDTTHGTFAFRTAGDERLRIASDGNIGIGINNPQRKLVVSDDGTEGFEFFPGDSVNGGTLNLYNRATSGWIPLTINSQDFRWAPSGGTEAFRINSSGNIGIGTVTPGNLLHLHGANGAAAIRLTESAYENMNKQTQFFNSQGNTYIQTRNDTNAGNFIVRGVASSGSATPEFLRIDPDGKLLIGINASTSSNGQIQSFKATGNESTIVVGNVATAAHGLCRYDFCPSNKVVGARIECHATEDFSEVAKRTADLVFVTRKDGTNAEKLRITSAGKVGIGITNPNAMMQIISDQNAETDRFNSSNYHLMLQNTGNDTGEAVGLGFAISDDTDKVGAAILHERSGGGSAGSLQFYTNSDGASVTERLRITSTGWQQGHAGYAGVGINTFASWARTGGAIRAEVGYNAVTLDYMYFGTGTTHPLALRTGNTNALFIDNNQKVGIGTDAPDNLLHLYKNNSTAWPFHSHNAVAGTYAYTPYPHELQLQNDSRNVANSFTGIYFHPGAAAAGDKMSTARIGAIDTGDYKADIAFGTRDTHFYERMRITAAGDVGINTTSPQSASPTHASTFQVNGDIVQARWNHPGKSTWITDSTNGDDGSEGFIGRSNGDLRIQTGASNYVAARPSILLKNAGGICINPSTQGNGSDYNNVVVGSESTSDLSKGYKLYVNGSFAATTKSFVIDHPTKENHQLRYACLEGPENSVYVRGRSSDSVIELPDYWVGLVHDDSITVNVTPIGNKNVWVESINNNSVTIGSDDSTEYFYTVFAERKDVEKLEVEVEN